MRPMIRVVQERWSTPIKGAEIGVWKGEHAEEMLRHLPKLETLYLVDPYESYEGYPAYDAPRVEGKDLQEALTEARRRAARLLRDYHDRISWKYAGFTHGLITEPLDFVYIDGNHTYAYVKNDIEVARGIVKPGGIIGGDDYYEGTNFAVKMAVDEAVKNHKWVLHVEGRNWWVVKSPKIFYFNLNVGSGIERTGNTVLKMLSGLEVVNYKLQNPPCITLPVLVQEKPDVIILNEFYARVIKAIYYYCIINPQCRFILLNHCSDLLHAMPFPKTWNRTDSDGVALINALIRNHTYGVFNLNHNPKPYPDFHKEPIYDLLHPIDNKFKWVKPWSERTIDFMYFGYMSPHKFSKEFIEKIKTTNLEVHMYGPGMKDQTREYTQLVEGCKNLIWEGFISEEDLVDTLNDCKYMIVPHDGKEPFNLCVAQAIRCGVVPLIIHRGEWLEWAEGCFRGFPSVDTLLKDMTDYVTTHKDNKKFLVLMNKASYATSSLMSHRTSFDVFKEKLLNVIEGRRDIG